MEINVYIFVLNRLFMYYEDYLISINQNLKGNIIKYDDTIEYYNNYLIELIKDKNNIIIFVYRLSNYLSDSDIKFKNIFFINTEQLTDISYFKYIIENVKDKFHIIDYSKENIDLLNIYNINNVIYFPYLYNSKENLNIPKNNILCSMTPTNSERRIRLYNMLQNDYGIKINQVSGWKKRRDIFLFSHKILLNISAFDDRCIFEPIRCYRCLFNKMIIISEIKYKHELIDYNKHIIFVSLEEMGNKIKDVIENYDYYYKLLELDNIDYHLNDNLVNVNILVKYTCLD